jgi:hypothetical protein
MQASYRGMYLVVAVLIPVLPAQRQVVLMLLLPLLLLIRGIGLR